MRCIVRRPALVLKCLLTEVREDMSDALDRIVPEDRAGKGLYRHSAEGPDDMPVGANPICGVLLDEELATYQWTCI